MLIRKKTDFYSAPSILYVWFECIHSYTAPCCEHVCTMQYMCSASPELHCKYIYTLLWQKDVSKFNFQYFFIPHAVVLFSFSLYLLVFSQWRQNDLGMAHLDLERPSFSHSITQSHAHIHFKCEPSPPVWRLTICTVPFAMQIKWLVMLIYPFISHSPCLAKVQGRTVN